MKSLIVLSCLLALSAAQYWGGFGAYSPYFRSGAVSPYWNAGYGYSGIAPFRSAAYVGAPAYSYGFPSYHGYYGAPGAVLRSGYAEPVTTAIAAPIVAPVAGVYAAKHQYHSQDALGQASYGFRTYDQGHDAVRDAAGRVSGSYGYLSPDGRQLHFDYTADERGFRVASNALPVAPVDPNHVNPIKIEGPVSVDFTPEVKAAREEHFAAIAKAKSAASGEIRRKRDTIAVAPLALPHYRFGSLYNHHVPLVRSGLAGVTAIDNGLFNVNTLDSTFNYLSPLRYSDHGVLASGASRDAILTRVANNPGHAESYRVD